jgi:hypothetical protein
MAPWYVQGAAPIRPSVILGHSKAIGRAGGALARNDRCLRLRLVRAEHVLELGAKRGHWLLCELSAGPSSPVNKGTYNGRAVHVLFF